MALERTLTPLELHGALTRFADLWNDRLLRNLPNHVIARLERRLPALTPRLSGRLASGWQRVPGARGLFKLRNPVEYAAVVLPGRRLSRRGRMVGSTKQPNDAVLTGLADLASEFDSTVDREFRALDGVE